MDIHQIITPIHLYFLSLLSMEYADLQQSFIGADGSVCFKFDLGKLPVPNIEIPVKGGLVRRYTSVNGILQDELFETTFFHNSRDYTENHFVPKESDVYYIHYDTMMSRTDSFTIKHKGKLYTRTYEYIGDILYLMEQCNHPEFQTYSEAYDKFNQQATEWVKEQIRVILTDLKGKYTDDKIIGDTYFQARNLDGQCLFYIVHQWWNKIRQKSITFADITNEEGNVYVALN